MVTRAREVLQYRESSDPKVSQANIVIRTGSTWRAQEAVRLRHSMMVGLVCLWPSLAWYSVPTTRYDKALGKDRSRLAQKEMRAGVDEEQAGTSSGPQDPLVRALVS